MLVKKILAVVALSVVVCGSYVVADRMLSASALRLLGELEQQMPQGASFTHGPLQTNLLRREVKISDIEIKSSDKHISALELRFLGLPWLSKETISIGALTTRDLVFEDKHNRVAAARMEISSPSLKLVGSVLNGVVTPADVSFSSFNATDMVITNRLQATELSLGAVDLGTLRESVLSDLSLKNFSLKQSRNNAAVLLEGSTLTAKDISFSQFMLANGHIDLSGSSLIHSVGQMKVGALTFKKDNQATGTLSSFDVENDGAALSMKLSGLAFSVDAMDAATRMTLEELGYSKLMIDAELVSQYDAQSKIMTLDHLTVKEPNSGELRVGFSLGNVVSLSEFAKNPASVQSLLPTMTFAGLDIKVTDGGLVGRFMKRGADRLKVEPSVYAEQLVGIIRPSSGQQGPGAQKIGQLYKAVSSFLVSPGVLTIQAKPAQPIAFMQILIRMKGLADLAEIVNLSSNNRQR